jgi:hypothetical protein
VAELSLGVETMTWVSPAGHDAKQWGVGGKPWPVGDMPPGASALNDARRVVS